VTNSEGVIKYQLDFTPGPEPDPALISTINAWRHILYLLRLIGQDDSRYDGYGYGNVSCRLRPGSDEFIISGTQTAHLPKLTAEHYVLVTNSDVSSNRIVASGIIKPSSEALTHGLLYQVNTAINVVFHVHCPQIWQQAKTLQIASSAKNVSYGTPEMALELTRLMQQQEVTQRGIFIMGGHEDGVLVFGPNAQETGNILVDTFAKALPY